MACKFTATPLPAMPSCPLTDTSARPVIAHRGGARRAPENTLRALAGARALGADAVELDVRLSRDGRVVVMHDPTVDRTTNGTGPVRAMSASDLGMLDAAARFTVDGGRTFPYRGCGIGVPLLDDVVASVDLPLLIEVKAAEALVPTVALLERLGATGRSVVAASDHAAVAPARGGELRTGASRWDAVRLLVRIGAPSRLPYEALCIPPRHHGIPLPMRLLVSRARHAGAVTHVWTVDDAADAQGLWQIGVAGIITDVPDVMVRARATL